MSGWEMDGGKVHNLASQRLYFAVCSWKNAAVSISAANAIN
jgi:hypothetical protein